MKSINSTTKLLLFVVAALLCISYLAGSTGAEYVKVGCFKDKVGLGRRALPTLIINFRQLPNFDWYNLDKYVRICASEAKKRNCIYFGMQFYGECWAWCGLNAALTYDRYGHSSNCYGSVGKALTNVVYSFTGAEKECRDYATLNSANRSALFQLPIGVPPSCDRNLVNIWYRFLPPAGNQMASTCVQSGKCGTVVTGWLSSVPPLATDGIVSGTVCFRWGSDCCRWSQVIQVRNCGRFFVYKLGQTRGCPMRFCAQ